MISKLLLGQSVLVFACVTGVEWDRANNPRRWSRSFEYQLDKLPQKAEVDKVPWSDSYWPNNHGGIARRWQDIDNMAPGFNYTLHSFDELMSGLVDITILSPAEKYDLLNCRYDYPLVKSEWRRCKPTDDYWEGLCDGWASAAINYDEPNAVTMVNKDGIVIPFGSSDVKALLTYFLGEFAHGFEETLLIGNRCDYDLEKRPWRADRRKCSDMNAGSFHLMMTNVVGIARTSFVGDIDRSTEVWNQPMVAYEYSLLESRAPDFDSAPGTVKSQLVNFKLSFLDDSNASATLQPPKIKKRRLQYYLDLNHDNKIIGGSYVDRQWKRIDFMWSSNAPDFFGYFEKLRDVYERARSTHHQSTQPKRRRITLADYKATLVQGNVIKLASVDDTAQQAWLINNPSKTTPLQLKFTTLNIGRNSGHIRIYEVENGDIQALVGVFQGTSPPEVIEIRQGISVLVTFNNERMATSRIRANSRQPDYRGFELVIL